MLYSCRVLLLRSTVVIIWGAHGDMGALKALGVAPHRQRFCAELFRGEKVHSHWVPVPAALRRRLPAIGAPREDAMRQTNQTKMRQATMRQASMISALVVMLPLIGPAAHAQTAPQQGPSPQVAPRQAPPQDG